MRQWYSSKLINRNETRIVKFYEQLMNQKLSQKSNTE